LVTIDILPEDDSLGGTRWVLESP